LWRALACFLLLFRNLDYSSKMGSSKIIAVIPARAGSKSIPKKNIRPFLGIPLLVHSIQTAKECEGIDRILVSTDSEEIAQIAKEHGAEVPFLRPAEISGDDSPDLPVFLHCLKWLREYGDEPEIFVHLRATSPIRRVKDIDTAIELLRNNSDADSIRSVCEPTQNPYKMWKMGEEFLQPLIEDIELQKKFQQELYNLGRQLLPKVYWQTGYLDVVRATTIEKNSMTGKNILPLFIPQELAIDLDSDFDWKCAEILWGTLLEKQ
jgi:CMP-N-acetylneuraminic acid synthetase